MSHTDTSPVTDERSGLIATSYVARHVVEDIELIDWAHGTGDPELIRDYGQMDESWFESLENDIIAGRYDWVDGPIPDAGLPTAEPITEPSWT